MKTPKLTETFDNTCVFKVSSIRDSFPLHTHTYYEFFLVTKGTACHIVNKAMQIVSRGSLVLVRPNDEHFYDYYKTQSFEFYNVGIPIELFNKTNAVYGGYCSELTKSPLPKHIHLDESTMFHFERYLEELADLEELAKNADERRHRLMLSRIVSYVFYQLLDTEELVENKVMPEWLIFVIEKMREPERFIEGLPCLLRLCNYSQEHINREFKRYLNTTPTRYINELRLHYAYNLLKNTNEDILDICENSGFHNLSHFYTEFKKYFGCTPNYVRKTTTEESSELYSRLT